MLLGVVVVVVVVIADLFVIPPFPFFIISKRERGKKLDVAVVEVHVACGPRDLFVSVRGELLLCRERW